VSRRGKREPLGMSLVPLRWWTELQLGWARVDVPELGNMATKETPLLFFVISYRLASLLITQPTNGSREGGGRNNKNEKKEYLSHHISPGRTI